MSATPLTKEAFEALLMEDSARGMKAVGRALVALLRRQTIDERTQLETRYANKIGFNAADARAGTGNAEFFMHHGYLTSKQVAFWREADKHGNVRICKYISQLLEVAEQKQKRIEEKRKQQKAQMSFHF